jgi:hypothetical protein
MKIKVLKLGTTCTDQATELKGTVTHWFIDMGQRIDYVFQPEGTNPDDGQPLPKIILELERLSVTEDDFEEVEVPMEILGTQIMDKPSGFSGMAVGFTRHTHGCFHVSIQPPGRLPKTNGPVKKTDFDLRSCIGAAIKPMTSAELDRDHEARPSPTDDLPERTVGTRPTFEH